MPNISDIVKTGTYDMIFDRYIELKVILSTAGVNLTALDKIKG